MTNPLINLINHIHALSHRNAMPVCRQFTAYRVRY